jgi:pimeloyl-ACP methyl ester carboxylesterase
MTGLTDFPCGERFDIGGYSLNLHRTGQGAPPAIFDTGLGVTSLLWARVLTAVGAFTCAFDRAGYGGSSPAPGQVPRTSAQRAQE